MTAPLISVPVILEKGGLDREARHYRHHISYSGEELSENLSLREKLRQDHGFDFPVFDEDEITPDDYFRNIQRAIFALFHRINGWIGCEQFTSSRTLLACGAEAHIWVSTKRKCFLFTSESVIESSILCAVWLNE